ncbi:MAG: 5'-methylthioadenosine/S-adenosylhomocysteine nucleosidase [Nanoarchaeota archaeon]|nr:5'-methylthioadenosine/S-adenosylhomocysteine nucleosidase [Nanoarchaeota archaeon]
MNKVVIFGAMPQEIVAYNERVKSGEWDCEVFVESTGVGKVAAAMVTQKAISERNPDYIIFSGVAGGLEAGLKIGDIGICEIGIDSDLDARSWNPSLERGEQPFSGNRIYRSNENLVDIAFDSGNDKLFRGYVASGSAFLNAEEKTDFVQNILPELETENVLPNVYDMESSAVMQVANQNGIPVLVIRAVSDIIEGNSASDFNEFINGAVENYVGVVDHLIKKWNGGK